MPDCTYCGCPADDQDGITVTVYEGEIDQAAGVFCNYGCLVSHVEDEGLAAGTSCAVSYD